MAEKPEQSAVSAVRLVEQDRIQIEFVIEDLVKQLIKDKISPVASCKGCNACSASVERVDPAVRR